MNINKKLRRYLKLNKFYGFELMKHLRLKDGVCYDGSQIEPMWAFRLFNIKESSIVSWIGPMDIGKDHLVDFEDIGLEIKGDKMLHFIIEHFDVQPANINLCYHRQRIFVMIMKDILHNIGIETNRNGDDLYFCKDSLNGNIQGKLSVSIATCSVSSMKIHFALNLLEKGTPKDVETAGILESYGKIKMVDVHNLINDVCSIYINEILSIKEDITKTRVF
jgi:uncharacterized protein